MGKPLRVLIVEDSEIDAGLVLLQLKHGGYDPEFERVETDEDMRTSLREKTWDVILCDYTMPRFDGLAAIALFKETGLDIPMIIVSGAIGEETAVAAMKAGAHDYIMKDKLARLVPAIERELRDSRSRKAHREADLQYRAIVEAQDDAICRWRPDMTLTYANTGYMELFDIEEKDIGCRKWIDFIPEAERAAVVSFYREFLQNKRKASYEHAVRLKDGSLRTYLWTDIPLFDDQGICWEIQSVGRDITDQKPIRNRRRKSCRSLLRSCRTLPSWSAFPLSTDR
jgi:sigma-B regulation protein RsbU (phosphoserine phosphatase)